MTSCSRTCHGCDALLLTLVSLVLSGCAAVTNPVADGIPAIMVPPEFLAAPKEGMETIPLSLLGQEPPDVYRIGPGDILGIYVAGVIGEPNEVPPVNLVVDGVETASLGFPVPVRENGSLTLPLIRPLSVEDMTIEEVEQRIIQAYTEGPEPIIKPGREQVIVTLARPRLTRVVVIRQDSPAIGLSSRRPGFVRSTREFRGGAESLFRGSANGTGVAVYLPAYQNDVLNALAKSGGLPGLDADNEIIIQRSGRGAAYGEDQATPETLELFDVAPVVEGATMESEEPGFGDAGDSEDWLTSEPPELLPSTGEAQHAGPGIVRIPLRMYPGEPLPFGPDDIKLYSGDVVFIEARDTEVFYTGGLLPSGEYPIPRDYDLTAVEAVVQVGGPLVNGGINSNNLTGALVDGGIGRPSPRLLSVLRPTPDGGQVPIIVDLHAALRDPQHNLIIRPGDMLILQETKHQALARYVSEIFNFSILTNVISRTDTIATTGLSTPNPVNLGFSVFR